MKLVLLETNDVTIRELAEAFRGSDRVQISKVEAVLYFGPPKGLDVLFLPLIAAERWGSKPLIHRSQVLPTRPEDQAGGLPKFIVTGVCLAPDDPRGPIPETKLLVSSAFDAIRAFNDSSPHKLEIVGFWAVNLLNGVSPRELSVIIRTEVPELYRPPAR